MKERLLALHQVCYTYEDSPFTLSDISVSVHQGERLAVLGGNGAGKSTFFLLCNGVLAPESGKLSYREKEITGKKRDLMELREKVGIVFQDPNQQLIGSTVEAEVSFGPMNLGLTRDEVVLRVDEALGDMRLESFRSRPPHYLSGGEKKRTSIAGVLAMRPELILFDEPTASLDPAGVEMLHQVLLQLEQGGKTLIVSTHDIDFAWSWARRILVFHQGQLVRDDTPEAVFSDEALLEQTSLRRPYLYEFAVQLKARGLLKEDAWPKTLDELDTLSVV